MSVLTRRAALGGGALAAGGLAAGLSGGLGSSQAVPSPSQDDEILRGLVLLEQVQERLYRQALDRAGLTGGLRTFAATAGGQEAEHARLLASHLKGRGPQAGTSDFGDAVTAPEPFSAAAIELEELVIAAYVGQGANLSPGLVGPFATIVSVEARQVAWLRDLAGEHPAPHAADPAKPLGAVLAELRDRGWLA